MKITKKNLEKIIKEETAKATRTVSADQLDLESKVNENFYTHSGPDAWDEPISWAAADQIIRDIKAGKKDSELDLLTRTFGCSSRGDEIDPSDGDPGSPSRDICPAIRARKIIINSKKKNEQADPSMKTLFESFRKWSNNSTALSEQEAVSKPGAPGTHPDQDGRPGPTVQNAEDAAELEDTINFQKAQFEMAKGIIQTVYSRWRTYGSAGQEITGLSLKKPQHKKILKGLVQLFFPLDRDSRKGTIGGPVMTSVGTAVNSMMDFEDADFEYWVYNPPRTHAGRNEKLFPGQSKQNIKEILMAIKLALKEANYGVPTISNQGREE